MNAIETRELKVLASESECGCGCDCSSAQKSEEQFDLAIPAATAE